MWFAKMAGGARRGCTWAGPTNDLNAEAAEAAENAENNGPRDGNDRTERFPAPKGRRNVAAGGAMPAARRAARNPWEGCVP